MMKTQFGKDEKKIKMGRPFCGNPLLAIIKACFKVSVQMRERQSYLPICIKTADTVNTMRSCVNTMCIDRF